MSELLLDVFQMFGHGADPLLVLAHFVFHVRQILLFSLDLAKGEEIMFFFMFLTHDLHSFLQK